MDESLHINKFIEKIQIRKIQKSDSSTIAELSAQLGYKVTSSEIFEQIVKLNDHNDHFAFVAVLEDEIVGYIHGVRTLRLTTSPFIEITGLIVREKYRGKRVGCKLVKHLEEQITVSKKIRVRCNVKRELAHKFYENLSYSEKKEQKIFEKKL